MDYRNLGFIFPSQLDVTGQLATSQDFQMVWQRKVLFVTAAMQGRYHAHDFMLDASRGYNIAEAVEVREVEDYRHTRERLLPPDIGNGIIWRIRGASRYEERDGGLYLEIEAVALTSDIPASVAWLVNPVVNHLSINSLTTTLRQTRDAVIAARGARQHEQQRIDDLRIVGRHAGRHLRRTPSAANRLSNIWPACPDVFLGLARILAQIIVI